MHVCVCMCVYLCVCAHTSQRQKGQRKSDYNQAHITRLCVCSACVYVLEFRKYHQHYLRKSSRKLNSHFLGYRKPISFALKLFWLKKKILSSIVWTRVLLLQLISSSRSKEYALLRYKLHKSRACETVVFVPHNAQYRRQMLSKQNSEVDYRRAISRSSLLFILMLAFFPPHLTTFNNSAIIFTCWKWFISLSHSNPTDLEWKPLGPWKRHPNSKRE